MTGEGENRVVNIVIICRMEEDEKKRKSRKRKKYEIFLKGKGIETVL